MNLKKAVLLSSCLFASAASAEVLNFDDIVMTGSYDSLSALGQSGYKGFTWDANWYVGNTSEVFYGSAPNSGTQFLSNGYAATSLSITHDTPYYFSGAYFTTPKPSNPAAYASLLTSQITISGYDMSGNLINSVSSAIDATANLWVSAGFSDVYSILITADKGWFTMDDFTFSSGDTSTPVPLPATLLLFSSGLLGLGFMSKRKQA